MSRTGFYGGQKTFELYIELADQIPPRYETWSSTLGRYGLAYALNQATGYLKGGGPAQWPGRLRFRSN